jgi:hypothetical protein
MAARRSLGYALVAGVVVLLALLLLPITGHHGDGEQTCGSVLRHTRVSGMVPRVDGAAHLNMAQSSDACPPEDYQRRESVALVASALLAGLTVGVTLVLRRRGLGGGV